MAGPIEACTPIFRAFLKFYKNIGIFNFEDHRCLIRSYIHKGKLKELSNLLNLHEHKSALAYLVGLKLDKP